MTVSSTTRKAGPFNGNGVTTQFPFTFKVFDDTDVLVVLTDADGVEVEQVLDTDYTLSLNADQDANPGGTITMLAAPATGYRLTSTSQVPNLQPTDITNGGGFYPMVIEDAIDRSVIQVQQLTESVNRSMVMPLSSDLASFQLAEGATADGRALRVIGFDADGNPALLDSADNAVLRGDLANVAAGKGAALVAIEDAGGEFSASTVEGALAELAAADNDLSSTATGKGASIVAIEDAAGLFDATNLEDAIAELWDSVGRVRPFDPVFGAAGNGVDDDTTPLQSAITAANAAGKELDLGGPNRTYMITSSLTIPSNSRITSRGAVIDASSLSGTKHAIVASGSVGSNSALTVDISAENAFSCTVADGSIFAAGEWVLINTETSYYPYAGYNVAKGEFAQIRSIAGNVLSFTNPIVDTYTVAAGGKVQKINWVENIVLDGVRVVGSATAASNERGICMRFARYFEIKGCVLDDIDQYMIEASMCLKFSIHENRLRGTFYDGVTGTIFYGIALVDANQHFAVHDNIGSQVRHLVVTTAASAGQGRWGQSLHGTIHSHQADDCMAGGNGRSFAYECHGTGRHLLWGNNRATGCYSFMRIEGGSDIEVIGGGCNGYAYQGLIIGGTGQTVERVTVQGVEIANYTAEVTAGTPAAIRVETSTAMSGVTIDGVKITKAAKSNVGAAISIGASTTQRNNVVRNVHAGAGDAESTGVAVSVAASASGWELEGNKLHGWRGGYSLAGDKIVVKGGSVENFSAAATGFGWYSNGNRNVCQDVHFRNIASVIRMDTLSTNNLAVNNTFTDCTTTTPSNSGTSNTTTPNYVV